MSTSVFMVMRLDENDWVPDPIVMDGPGVVGNSEIVRANCAEDAAVQFGRHRVGPEVGSYVKVRVVTLWSAYSFEAVDYVFKREPSPVVCTLTSSHEIDRER